MIFERLLGALTTRKNVCLTFRQKIPTGSASLFLPPPKRVKQSSAIGSDGPILVDLSRPQLQVTESDEEAELKRFKEAV